jgi:RNA polymerase sigma-70 factor (ECF subfamily)
VINPLRLTARFGPTDVAAIEAVEANVPIGDAAFEALVDAHYRRTYNLIYRMVRNESDAADLTQETFVRVYRALPRLREAGAQTAWVRRIATNLCLDFLRRRNATPSIASLDARPSEESDSLLSWDIADPSSEPDRLFSSKERLAMLHRAIESLPDDYRAVIVMHHIEEMRVEEIGDALGVPAGTIKSRLSRARRELHRKLSPYFDPDLTARR